MLGGKREVAGPTGRELYGRWRDVESQRLLRIVFFRLKLNSEIWTQVREGLIGEEFVVIRQVIETIIGKEKTEIGSMVLNEKKIVL